MERRKADATITGGLGEKFRKIIEAGGKLEQLRSVDYNIEQEVGQMKDDMRTMSVEFKANIQDMDKADTGVRTPLISQD